MDDATREALDRLRRELAGRGVTLLTKGEDSGQGTAAGGSAVQVQALPCNDDEQEPTVSKRLPARRWLRYALLVLGLFAVLPWLAPIFAAVGWWGLADPIYTAYMFLCHQLPERAAFLFGYQVAFCWRNAAIYTGLFGFGLLYALSTMPRSGRGGSQRVIGTKLLHCLRPAQLAGLRRS